MRVIEGGGGKGEKKRGEKGGKSLWHLDVVIVCESVGQVKRRERLQVKGNADARKKGRLYGARGGGALRDMLRPDFPSSMCRWK